ncbi:MAG: L-serine ammonia-lyase, iron-sulfur-dependent subunit beta [Tissierellia bacterium]|nr:L-serine ammonia-lyase, iron-sulfur-dependent subunit beta [Tissierellia bacterium]
MNKYNVFDIVGPIMVGPSSSHTAGACRIAGAALNITEGKAFDRVLFRLHGSFASTYRGHGTDMALVGGINGLGPSDPDLLHAFEISKKRGISWSFEKADLGEVHPNSVEIVFYFKDGERLSVMGSSIGGGNIVIIAINNIQVEFKNEFPALIVQYYDQPGIIAFVSSQLMTRSYNIESIITHKEENLVTLLVETTERVDQEALDRIFSNDEFIFTKYIDLVKEEDHVS